MVDVSAPARLSFGWILWPAAVVGLTVAMFPVAVLAPIGCLAVGLGLGWWARRGGLRLSMATAATLVGCALITSFPLGQHLSVLAWQNGGPLMPPDHGYLESNDWFRLSDSLIMFPGEWTFLLVVAVRRPADR